MKTESSSNNNINNNSNKMDFDLYPSISGKQQQDPVREVVMKYIDYFLPDASGTSAVAIDNKIEQAMDLVKSHLMIAVREEVEVLKERISELMDKINKLELENNILKSNIPQETLQQLQIQLQIAGSQQPAAVAAPPATPAIQAAPATAGAAAAAVATVVSGAGGASSQSATPATATSPVQSTVAALPNGSVNESNGTVVVGGATNSSSSSSNNSNSSDAVAAAAAVAATVTAAATAVEQQQQQQQVQSSTVSSATAAVNGPMS